jgi:hypothetical protein
MWHVWVRGVVNRGFWWGNVRGRNHLEYVGIYIYIYIYIYIWEHNIRNVSLKNGGRREKGSVYRIDLPQDRDTWLALVKTVLNLWVP